MSITFDFVDDQGPPIKVHHACLNYLYAFSKNLAIILLIRSKQEPYFPIFIGIFCSNSMTKTDGITILTVQSFTNHWICNSLTRDFVQSFSLKIIQFNWQKVNNN